MVAETSEDEYEGEAEQSGRGSNSLFIILSISTEVRERTSHLDEEVAERESGGIADT